MQQRTIEAQAERIDALEKLSLEIVALRQQAAQLLQARPPALVTETVVAVTR